MRLSSHCFENQRERSVHNSITTEIGHVVEKTLRSGKKFFPKRAIKCLLAMLNMYDMRIDYPLNVIDDKSHFKEKYQDGKDKNIFYTVYKNLNSKKDEPSGKESSSTQCTMLMIIQNIKTKDCCLYNVNAVFRKGVRNYEPRDTKFKCCDFDAFASSIRPNDKYKFLNSGFAVAMVAESGILKSGTPQKCLHNSEGCLELDNVKTYAKVCMIHLEHVKAVSKGKDHVLLGGQKRFLLKNGETIRLVEDEPSKTFWYNPVEDWSKTPMA